MSTEGTVTLYHNPNCSKSRGALELLDELARTNNLSLNIIEYLHAPPDRVALTTLLQKLPDAPIDLVRNDKNFKALELNASDYVSAESVIDLLLSHPELMQRPLVIYNNKALIARPPEDLLELFK